MYTHILLFSKGKEACARATLMRIRGSRLESATGRNCVQGQDTSSVRRSAEIARDVLVYVQYKEDLNSRRGNCQRNCPIIINAAFFVGKCFYYYFTFFIRFQCVNTSYVTKKWDLHLRACNFSFRRGFCWISCFLFKMWKWVECWMFQESRNVRTFRTFRRIFLFAHSEINNFSDVARNFRDCEWLKIVRNYHHTCVL